MSSGGPAKKRDKPSAEQVPEPVTSVSYKKAQKYNLITREEFDRLSKGKYKLIDCTGFKSDFVEAFNESNEVCGMFLNKGDEIEETTHSVGKHGLLKKLRGIKPQPHELYLSKEVSPKAITPLKNIYRDYKEVDVENWKLKIRELPRVSHIVPPQDNGLGISKIIVVPTPDLQRDEYGRDGVCTYFVNIKYFLYFNSEAAAEKASVKYGLRKKDIMSDYETTDISNILKVLNAPEKVFIELKLEEYIEKESKSWCTLN